ncbi:membrane protein [Salipiger pallidus]|uniref:Probable membrane transporter protein n=1 Tax=Salipiger pallidus TaxID=1775170 RepID=A0A8J3EFS9_9RHOB|nr:sulfite exporter TauE/SafE family protein [Salipiger pallidus]GGG66449.1 membrane protein [Salipiger pallidus]
MDSILTLISPQALLLSLMVASMAGIVKGMVGFALPMIMISGLGSFLAPDLALAGLILPTLATNALQGLRHGPAAAFASLKRFGFLLGVGLGFLLVTSQMVRLLPVPLLFAIIGGPVALFCVAQILGWKARLPGGGNRRIEAAVGAVAGSMGGLSGVWGPPFVAYLTAIDTPKAEQVRIQGVAYGLGAVALTGAHVMSGVFTPVTAGFSALLLIPAMIGMWLGTLVHDRIDQTLFRKMTLWVLLIAALNLLRRAVMA